MTVEELIKIANDCNKNVLTVSSLLDDISIRKFVNNNNNSLSKLGRYTLELLNKHELTLATNYGDWPIYHHATYDEETKEYHLLACEIIKKVTQREEADECILFLYGRKDNTQDFLGYVTVKVLTYKEALDLIKDSKTDYNGNARITFKDGFIKYYKNYGEEYNKYFD